MDSVGTSLKRDVFRACFALALFLAAGNCQAQITRVAVLDFGQTHTGMEAAIKVRQMFVNKDDAKKEFTVIDREMTSAAAVGSGYQGSLNLTLQEARDLGAAMGCDFYFLGDAQTLRRSPSTGPAYFESFASIFIISTRTGRLVLWERPLLRANSAEEAEAALLRSLSSEETRHRYIIAIRRAIEDEREARTAAVETPPPVIDVMADEETDSQKDVRAPRPYRRLKPPYPESASIAEVAAIVDVLVDIDVRGEVGRVEVTRWAGYGLDQSVLDTVRQMHFFPAMREGVAIPMRVLLRYNFRKPAK